MHLFIIKNTDFILVYREVILERACMSFSNTKWVLLPPMHRFVRKFNNEFHKAAPGVTFVETLVTSCSIPINKLLSKTISVGMVSPYTHDLPAVYMSRMNHYLSSHSQCLQY